jgi:hypothetical protein
VDDGSRDPETDVSGNDPIVTGRIALAHLTEYPEYCTRLATLERDAAAHTSTRT